MTGRAELWVAAARLAADGCPFAFVTVARQRGSLPMALDAKMVVTEAGYHAGTVGGGPLEAEAIAEAQAVIHTGTPRIVTHTLNTTVAGDLGLSCGGTVELFVEPVAPDPRAVSLFQSIGGAVDARARVAVVTPLERADAWSKGAWLDDRKEVVGGVKLPDREGIWSKPGTHAFVDTASGVFVERIPRVSRLIIFGAGHVGREICRLAASVGFYVVLTDDREEFARRDHAPDAHEVVAGELDDVLGRITLDADDYVLATTRGHGMDQAVIARTAASDARYVGMLGSRRKRAVIWKALERDGIPPEAVERVRSPVGLDIGAKDPAEIAVSVVAELIRVRHEGEAA